MLEGDPPLANFEPYEAAKYVRETGLHFAQKDMSLNLNLRFLSCIIINNLTQQSFTQTNF